MNDFNNFDPSKSKLHFNMQKQGKNAQPESEAPEEETAASGPNWQSLPADAVLDHLLAKSMLSRADIQNTGIRNSMLTFGQMVSPARHAETTLMLKNAYISEFGRPPSAALLQDMVDDLLIGRPNIQTA